MKKETEKEFVILSEVVSMDKIAGRTDKDANILEHKIEKNVSSVEETEKIINEAPKADEKDAAKAEENILETQITEPINSVNKDVEDKNDTATAITVDSSKNAETDHINTAAVNENDVNNNQNAAAASESDVDKNNQNAIAVNINNVDKNNLNTDAADTGLETTENAKKRFDFKAFMKNKKFMLTSLAVILVAILYSCVAYNYRNTFFMGTTINGIDCAGMTVEEVESCLREKIEDYELSIVFRDGTTEVISGENIGYKYVSDGSVQQLMDEQISFAWITGIFAPPAYEIAESIEFDRGLLASEYYALGSTAEEKMIAPVNSYVTYEGDQFIVVPEDEGNQIDHHALIMKINEAVAASGTEIIAEECGVYARPTVFRDSEDLKKECEQLNVLADVSITYTLANREYVLDGNEVRNWLKVDEQGNYSITEDEMKAAIAAFVDRLAEEVDTVKTERPFKATMQGDITVGGGSYGWKVSQKEEEAKIAEEIANHAVVTREPCYSSRELTTENNGFGNTYIEIDLSNQHLWYYIDGELYVESDIVSGTYYTSSRRTPGGIFLLTYKQRDKVLRGAKLEDGTYEYESPVSFWMPFNGGIGLHDATWRGSFGGSIYKYSGSHGCINLPYRKAEAIYAEIDKETPIICYY